MIKQSPRSLVLIVYVIIIWQRLHVSRECCLGTSYYKQGYCINRIITQSEYILWTRITIHMCTASSKFVSSNIVLSFLTRRLDWNMTYRVFSEWQRNIAHSTNTDQSTSQPTPFLTPGLVLSPYLIIIRHEEVCYWAIRALHLSAQYNTGPPASQPDTEYEVMLKMIVFCHVLKNVSVATTVPFAGQVRS
jgi:hypothetical protein